MTSRGAERGMTASLALGAAQDGVVSQNYLSYPKCGLECKPMLGQDQKSDGHIPESTLGQAVPVWKAGESLSAQGLVAKVFFSGELGASHHRLVLSE